MQFKILNVEHGFAAYAIAADQSVIVFDCGKSNATRLSEELVNMGVTRIKRLFILNYDEDHIGDLPALRMTFPIDVLSRNTSVTGPELEDLKEGVSEAMESMIDMIETYTQSVNPSHPGVEIEFFYNRFHDFEDTNNLSLLVFVKIDRTCIALGGDLEVAGWKKILSNPRVRERLGEVGYFVASHHGRESGYCKEVFDYCHPNAVIFSDGPIKQDSQNMAAVYGKHASGIQFNGQHRKVLTTRNDGSLTWNF